MITTPNALKQLSEKSKDKFVSGFLHPLGQIEMFEGAKRVTDMKCLHCKADILVAWPMSFTDEKLKHKNVAICISKECNQKKQHKPVEKKKSYDWGSLGIPSLYHEKTYDNYQGFEVRKQAIKDFIRGKSWCITFYGVSGTGKTHLAVAALKDYYNFGHVSVFLTITNFLDELRDAQTNNKNEYDIIKKYSEYPGLLIDDLGTNRGTEWQIEKIYELIDMRFTKQKKTIITTNLSAEELMKMFGARLKRRISENGEEIDF